MRRWVALGIALTLMPAAAGAQSLDDYDYDQLSFRGVGLDIGRIFPNKVENATVYALRLDLGYLGPYVRVVPAFSYWGSELKGSEIDRLVEQLNALDANVTAESLGPIDWSAYSLSLDAQAIATPGFGISPFAGLGLGIHVMNGGGPSIDGTFVEDLLDSVSAGAAAMAGIEFALSSGFHLTAQARYTLQSDLRYSSFHIGGGYRLPVPVAASTAP